MLTNTIAELLRFTPRLLINAEIYYRKLRQELAKNTHSHRRFEGERYEIKSALPSPAFISLFWRLCVLERSLRFNHSNATGIDMIANHKLAAAISDCGFYEFRRQLAYKYSLYGTKYELVDRWYPQSKTCSNFGHLQSMPLKERVFNYQHCGAIIEGDMNAAINLARQSELVRPVRPEVTPVDKLRAYSLGR